MRRCAALRHSRDRDTWKTGEAPRWRATAAAKACEQATKHQLCDIQPCGKRAGRHHKNGRGHSPGFPHPAARDLVPLEALRKFSTRLSTSIHNDINNLAPATHIARAR